MRPRTTDVGNNAATLIWHNFAISPLKEGRLKSISYKVEKCVVLSTHAKLNWKPSIAL